jgi:hypothetical protein
MPLQARPENLRAGNSCESMIDQFCVLFENLRWVNRVQGENE